MSFNTKNYQETCDKLVIGGALEIKEGASITGLPQAKNQVDSTATTVADLKSDFNSLLSKLKSSGLMEDDQT
nr:MAG TPA: Head fiber protein [Caudoviricetes sp.]